MAGRVGSSEQAVLYAGFALAAIPSKEPIASLFIVMPMRIFRFCKTLTEAWPVREPAAASFLSERNGMV